MIILIRNGGSILTSILTGIMVKLNDQYMFRLATTIENLSKKHPVHLYRWIFLFGSAKGRHRRQVCNP
jgi:hypothetical protein